MNLILLEPGEVEDGRVHLTGRRHLHVRDQLRAEEGDRLRVGQVDGPLGDAIVIRTTRHGTALEVVWVPTRPPPKSSPLVLAFALPRPPTLRKVLSQATAMGIKRFEVFAARRVEKSYWDSSALGDEEVAEQLRLGLEQSGDTVMPAVRLHRRFRPFAEDVLGRSTPEPVFVLDPTGARECPRAQTSAATVVIGPEGGFIPFELECFASRGYAPVGLGRRILRVETAVVATLGRLAP